MAGLLDSLTSAARSLSTARLGLEVAGQNLANINTEGYSRRALVLAEVPPIEQLGAGRASPRDGAVSHGGSARQSHVRGAFALDHEA
jgi:flagellar hook-associated protein FlgK